MTIKYSTLIKNFALISLIFTFISCSPEQKESCGYDLVSCDGRCVDTVGDFFNCGECGNRCETDEFCEESVCTTLDCTIGLTNCDGFCKALTSDPFNCGICGKLCGTNEICEDSVCIDNSCTETVSEAQSGVAPVDIIVVVDNSGSMTEEAVFAQDSMNDFVTTILNSNIDTHVILISDDSDNDEGICVPAPLGSGACPVDENLPEFRHLVQVVNSSDSLSILLSTYDQWKDSLRSNAIKAIMVITDDDSAMSAVDFSTQLVALDPTFEGFTFSAIISPYELLPFDCMGCGGDDCASCDPCCAPDPFGIQCVSITADEGVVYKELIASTGGVEGNLCAQDFQPAFDALATEVILSSQVDCVYNIPDPGGELTIDYGKVNVEYKPNATTSGQTIYFKTGLEECTSFGGWYYDDNQPPQQILLCPDTCSMVQANMEASISVSFGCATIIE
jgi:Stigma-specific protein, Stig1